MRQRQREPGDLVLGIDWSGPKPGPDGSAIGWALIRPPTGSVELFGRDAAEEALRLARRARDRRSVTAVELTRYLGWSAQQRSEHANQMSVLEHLELVERTRRLLLADGFTVTIKEVR